MGSITLDFTSGGVPSSVSLTLAQLKGLAGSPQKITTDKGELVLSGFDEATGKVSYSYTAKVLPHTGGADLHDDFGLTITDANGKTGSTPARGDHGHDAGGSAGHQQHHRRCGGNGVTGSVLTGTGADTASKDSGLTVATLDGTAVTTAGTTINGAYGTLVIKADGSYTYTLNNAPGGQPAQ